MSGGAGMGSRRWGRALMDVVKRVKIMGPDLNDKAESGSRSRQSAGRHTLVIWRGMPSKAVHPIGALKNSQSDYLAGCGTLPSHFGNGG